MRSTDKGGTWSDPILIDQLRTIGVTDPETGDDVRTGDIIPDIAVAPDNGDLYAVWQDARCERRRSRSASRCRARRTAA